MPSVTTYQKAPTIAGAKPVLHPRLGAKGLAVHNAPKQTYLQCSGYNPLTGEWRLTQALSLGKGKAESQIQNIFSNTGDYRNRTVLYGGGHGSSWGYIGNSILTQFDNIGTNKKVTDRRLALIPSSWRGNKTSASSGVKFFDPVAGYMSPTTDTVHKKVGVRSVNAAGLQTFRLYDWTEFTAGHFSVEAQVSFMKLGTFQGWATFGDTFWTLFGKTDGRAFIYEYKWSKASKILGKPVAKLEVTALLKKHRRTSHEPEGLFVVNFCGLTTLMMGARFDSASRRRFLVFNVCSILHSTVQTEAATRLLQDWPIKTVSAAALAKARAGKYTSRHVFVYQQMLWKQGSYRAMIDGKWGAVTEEAHRKATGGSGIQKLGLDMVRLAAIRNKLSNNLAKSIVVR